MAGCWRAPGGWQAGIEGCSLAKLREELQALRGRLADWRAGTPGACLAGCWRAPGGWQARTEGCILTKLREELRALLEKPEDRKTGTPRCFVAGCRRVPGGCQAGTEGGRDRRLKAFEVGRLVGWMSGWDWKERKEEMEKGNWRLKPLLSHARRQDGSADIRAQEDAQAQAFQVQKV